MDNYWLAVFLLLMFQLVIVYLDYNSTEAVRKSGKGYETVPLTIWFQTHLGKWWGLATATVQIAILAPPAFFCPPEARWVYAAGVLCFQAYYYFKIIVPNYKIAHGG